MTNLVLEHKQCLVAGDGLLPINMAKSAKQNGFEVVCISLSSDNVNELKNTVQKLFHMAQDKLKQLRHF